MLRQSDQIGELAAALAAAQPKLGAVIRNKTADIPGRAYSYADLAAVFEAVREPLSEQKLAIIQGVGTDGANVTVTTRLLHSSGQWIESELTTVAAGADPQKIGSAITYGRRYSISALVGIAPEDDDGAAASQRPAKQQPQSGQQQPTQQQSPSTEQPDPVKQKAEELKARLRQMGCNDAPQANAVVSFVTRGRLKSFSQAAKTDANIAIVQSEIATLITAGTTDDKIFAAALAAAQPKPAGEQQ